LYQPCKCCWKIHCSWFAAQLPEFLLAWPELDALVCVSDELACGALYECQRRRINLSMRYRHRRQRRLADAAHVAIAKAHDSQIVRHIEAGKALLERLNDGDWRDQKPIASSLCLRESC
jgi:DNA-binding LacI/PurR family transcriptional regulator